MDEEIKLDEKEVLGQVADAITDEPIKYKVEILHPTRLERLQFRLGIKKPYREFDIKPASLAKFIKISKLLLAVDVKSMDMQNAYGAIQGLAASHGEKLAEVVAIALHPGRGNPPKSLVNFLMDNLTNKEMQSVANVILERGNAVSFFASIISMKGINILEMSPQDQGRSIASGQL